ncbi:MAG: HAD family hydrolase [Pyrobaculum sp.]
MATILVDLDGTLLPLSAWNPVFREVCTQIAEVAGVSAEEVWRRVRRLNLEMARSLDWRAFDWQYLFNLAARELGAPHAPDILATLRRHIHTFRPVDRALEALAKLKEMGHRVEIATNGHAPYQLPVISQLGLDRVVDGVRTSDFYKCPKSCPDYFRGADVMVGDNPIFDVYFPKKYGLKAVFYGDWETSSRTYAEKFGVDLSSTAPDAKIKTIKELPQVVELLLKN